ncbi:3-phosphoserine/phosphohydroxythreonine transaminase [Lacticaseibacillus hulanensis]|uniref:3-phosphoserine/phosphohydroxythreonine transaminase n=1 Tax=Lacticaseibacillus hulanensis TaxID=2493111 RepID=UPI000FDB6F4C|nr:3-phosphoserine/phosphohydroxythreonine transaminase [Lacticaseibacillus hulanensis]
MPVYNFAAGPAVMPASVIAQIGTEMASLNGSGMSILEVSHRGRDFDAIIREAEANLRTLMHIPDDYAVLFMQGGGTGQFAAAPLNLATTNRRIAVLDSGQWAVKAAEEATKLGVAVDVLASTKAQQYAQLPNLAAPMRQNHYDYLHVCVNNTIEGTMFRQLPDAGATPIVADMSSNILAQEYDVRDFGMIFAGAQKNLGPAGVTVVIVRKNLVKQVPGLPSMLDYQLFMTKRSLSNTPPVFAIYAVNLVLRWVITQGGVAAMQRRNEVKAGKLYAFLDESHLFHSLVHRGDRSLTNVTFTTGDADLDAKAVRAASAEGLMNLAGHRIVGGLRASLYNAMPLAGVTALIDFLNDFEQHNQLEENKCIK